MTSTAGQPIDQGFDVQACDSTASSKAPRFGQETELLLAFLRERDYDCPRCGYNLCNLTQPVCPECREELVLKVGVSKLRLHWLIATLAPGMFSGIAAGLFVLMCVLEGPPPRGMWQPWAVFAFLIVSGLGALIIALSARAFLKSPPAVQSIWAAGTWGIHSGLLVVLLLYA